jgi:dienelactone hydrolase
MKNSSVNVTLQRVFSTCFFSTFVFSVFTFSCVTQAAVTMPVALDPTVNEQVVMLPVYEKGQSFQFETTIFKPPGDGPFPLLLMNHGKDRGDSHKQPRDRFLAMSREFVKRGYAVVVPMRKGFATSTGSYDDYGCNMKDNGLQQASDIEAVLNAFQKMRWVDHDRVIVAGQSYGGLATLAFGTLNYPGVRGLLNFAGGLRIDGSSCDWKNSLANAFANYGARTALPSLWFYGQNDSYFDPALAQRLQTAYQSSGGASQLIAYGAFKNDAHGMVGSRDGVSIWRSDVERFLQRIGMPFEVTVAIADTPRPAATHFAPIENVTAVPFVTDKGREGYRNYLAKSAPRAFAISGSGAWSWAEEGDDPASRAVDACQQTSKLLCQLYSIDNDVVWSDASTAAPVAVN